MRWEREYGSVLYSSFSSAVSQSLRPMGRLLGDGLSSGSSKDRKQEAMGTFSRADPGCATAETLQCVIGGRGMHRSPERAICFSSRVSASCDVSVAPLRPHSAPPRGRTLPQQNP
jgi:hypothetical protein